MGLIDDKLNAILKADTALSDALKRIDQQLAIEIIKIYSDFVIDGDLVIDATKLAQIDEAIIAAISSTDYKLAVDQFITTFEEIEELNKQLHKAVNDEDITKILESNDRINNFKKGVEDQLRGTPTRMIQVTDAAGVVQRVPFPNPALEELITPIGEMIRQDVITGTSFKAATEQMLEAIKKKNLGLEQWAGQIARDSLEQADGITQQAVKDELGLKYSRYIGGLMSTSRPICYHLMTKKSDPVYTDEEIQDVLDEYAPGGIPSSSKITYSPLGVTRTAEKGSGIIPGTDSNNFHQRRGGYNCHHRFIPLSKKENEEKLLAESDEDEAVTQTEFKPAKTVKEAEFFAEQQGLVKKANYKKVSVDYANATNEQLLKLKNEHGATFDEITSVRQKTAKGASSVMTHQAVYSDGKFEKSVLKLNGGTVDFIRDKMEAINKQYPKMKMLPTDSDVVLLNKWHKQSFDERWFSTTNMIGGINHEYGHMLTQVEDTIEKAKNRRQLLRFGNRDISRYAGTSGDETLAETFAKFKEFGINSLTSDQIEFFNKYSKVKIK